MRHVMCQCLNVCLASIRTSLNLTILDGLKIKQIQTLKRYIRIENDPAIGWSVVGSGTKHKYLLYFNGQFPICSPKFCEDESWNFYTQLMLGKVFLMLLHKAKDRQKALWLTSYW